MKTPSEKINELVELKSELLSTEIAIYKIDNLTIKEIAITDFEKKGSIIEFYDYDKDFIQELGKLLAKRKEIIISQINNRLK